MSDKHTTLIDPRGTQHHAHLDAARHAPLHQPVAALVRVAAAVQVALVHLRGVALVEQPAPIRVMSPLLEALASPAATMARHGTARPGTAHRVARGVVTPSVLRGFVRCGVVWRVYAEEKRSAASRREKKLEHVVLERKIKKKKRRRL